MIQSSEQVHGKLNSLKKLHLYAPITNIREKKHQLPSYLKTNKETFGNKTTQ